MLLQLHIWGPAFGLPSFDAECIAATAYLNRILRSDQWVLVAAHDPSPSPTGDFPALFDGSTWIGGYSAIVAYLAGLGHSLDSHLSPRQRADSVALQAHLSLHALPLVSHHLHTSPTTYSTTTLPALSRTLPTALAWTVPSLLHSPATARAASAGLSFVDDQTTAPTSQAQNDANQLHTTSPSLLFARRQTLQAALRNEQSKLRFRVEAALGTALDPMAALFQGDNPGQYLLNGDAPTSIDCLAFGYLALLLYPLVPSSWLQETLRARFAQMAQYADNSRCELFGTTDDISVDVVMRSPPASSLASPPDTPNSLPWRTPPAPTTLLTNLRATLTTLLLPILHHPVLAPHSSALSPSTSLFPSPSIPTALPIFGAFLASALAYTLYAYPVALSEWSSFGGGERDKIFRRPLRSSRRLGPEWLGREAGFGDAEDVLGVLFAGGGLAGVEAVAGEMSVGVQREGEISGT